MWLARSPRKHEEFGGDAQQKVGLPSAICFDLIPIDDQIAH